MSHATSAESPVSLNIGIIVQIEYHREGKLLLIWPQRAYKVAKTLGQHRYSAVDEIYTCGTLHSLLVYHRTHKIFHGLEEICYEMDLGNPIWLDSTVKDFKKHDKARFYQDNFIEQIEFDYLEIQVIEED